MMDRTSLLAAMQATAQASPKRVEVPGWGEVYVRSITVAEVEEQEQDDPKDKHRIAKGVARLICDANGVRMFDPANEADVKLLASQPWKLLRRIVQAAGKEDDDDEGKDLAASS